MRFNLKHLTTKIIAAVVCICFFWSDIAWATSPQIYSQNDYIREKQFAERFGPDLPQKNTVATYSAKGIGTPGASHSEVSSLALVASDPIDIGHTLLTGTVDKDMAAVRGVVGDDLLRVVEQLRLQPFTSARIISENLDLTPAELTRYYRIIQSQPWLQAFIEENSPYASYIKYIRLVMDDAEMVSAFLSRKSYGYPKRVVFHIGTKCPANCIFCYRNKYGLKAGYNLQQDIYKLTPGQIRAAVDELADNGTKIIDLSGGLEPLTDKANTIALIDKAAKRQIWVNVYTNGILMGDDRIMQYLLKTAHVRISLSAATPQTYHNIFRVSHDPDISSKVFHRVLDNIRTLVEMKRKIGSDTQIGIHFLLQPDNYRQIINISRLAARLGVDFLDVRSDYLGISGGFSPEQIPELLTLLDELYRQLQEGKIGKLRIDFGDTFKRLNDKFTLMPLYEFPDERYFTRGVFPFSLLTIDPFGIVWGTCTSANPGIRDDWGKEHKLGRLTGGTGIGSILDTTIRSGRTFRLNATNTNASERILLLELERIEEDLSFGIPVEAQPFFTPKAQHHITTMRRFFRGPREIVPGKASGEELETAASAMGIVFGSGLSGQIKEALKEKIEQYAIPLIKSAIEKYPVPTGMTVDLAIIEKLFSAFESLETIEICIDGTIGEQSTTRLKEIAENKYKLTITFQSEDIAKKAPRDFFVRAIVWACAFVESGLKWESVRNEASVCEGVTEQDTSILIGFQRWVCGFKKSEQGAERLRARFEEASARLDQLSRTRRTINGGNGRPLTAAELTVVERLKGQLTALSLEMGHPGEVNLHIQITAQQLFLAIEGLEKCDYAASRAGGEAKGVAARGAAIAEAIGRVEKLRVHKLLVQKRRLGELIKQLKEQHSIIAAVVTYENNENRKTAERIKYKISACGVFDKVVCWHGKASDFVLLRQQVPGLSEDAFILIIDAENSILTSNLQELVPLSFYTSENLTSAIISYFTIVRDV